MITFIRHNKLEAPFDDYNNLNFQDLIDLANKKISPSISKNLNQSSILSKLQKIKFDKIYTSTQQRTIETANIL
jgi:hypothetical protein